MRPLPLVLSATFHALAAGTLLWTTAPGRATEPPVVGVTPVPLTTDFHRPQPTPDFLPARLSAPILVPNEIETDFLPDRAPVREVEIAAPLARPDRPRPTLDRPLASAERLAPAESTPQARTDAEVAEVHNPPPVYPAAARRRGLEGEVLVEITILENGTCGDARVVQSSGSTLFGDAALQAVRGWKYRPALRGGRPVTVTHRVRFVFRLDA